jgi:putative ABC transport system permease protein
MLQDLRYGIRVLLRKPSFSLIAIITLALGIGANTAIFSVIYAVLLRPLPFLEPDRLAILEERTPKGYRMSVAYPNYMDWRERAKSFKEMACFQSTSFNLTDVVRPVRLQGGRVNWNLFQLLGVKPQLGRLFVERDDRVGAAPTALISNGLWKNIFGGDPNVIGRMVRIDGDQFTVIGVLPPAFEFLRHNDLYVPLGLTVTPESGILDRGNHSGLYVLGRLQSGVTVEQARQEMESISAQLEREYPNTNSGTGAMTQKLIDVLVEEIRPALIVLFGAVVFVLGVACVNVANLLLVRAAERQRDIAVRLALGAGRWRIVRQLLSESMLISVLGGTAGLLIGVWVMNSLVSLAPSDVPRLGQVKLSATVLIFTMCLSVLTGLMFGLIPALHISRTNLQSTLKEGGRSTVGLLQENMRKILVVAELALALVLLIGAGLMLRTVSQLMRVDPGFNTENLLTMQFTLPPKAYHEERCRVFYRECLTKIEALPGVVAAALTLSLPIDGSNWNSFFIVADKPVPPRKELPKAAFTQVSANYFKTMGIRLLKGRIFSDADSADTLRVTVINEMLARRLWPGEDPIGKRLKQGWPEDQSPWRIVIGVVRDVKLNGIDRETPLQAYLPLTQETSNRLNLVARTGGNPLTLASTVEQTIHSIDNELPVFNVRSMDQLVDNSIAQQRLTMSLLAGFSILALTLAAVGIYGVMSYTVTQRTHEIGLRMALGAQQVDVLKLVLRQGMILTLIGLTVGLVVAFALARLMSTLVYGVSVTDPATFAAIALLLAGVAMFACYIPARRAAKVDPMIALRFE